MNIVSWIWGASPDVPRIEFDETCLEGYKECYGAAIAAVGHGEKVHGAYKFSVTEVGKFIVVRCELNRSDVEELLVESSLVPFGPGKVVKGFLEAARRYPIEFFKDLKNHLPTTSTLVFTGRVLSGSVAALLTALVLEDGDSKENNVMCVGFNAPFVGDAHFRQHMKDKHAVFVQAVDVSDPTLFLITSLQHYVRTRMEVFPGFNVFADFVFAHMESKEANTCLPLVTKCRESGLSEQFLADVLTSVDCTVVPNGCFVLDGKLRTFNEGELQQVWLAEKCVHFDEWYPRVATAWPVGGEARDSADLGQSASIKRFPFIDEVCVTIGAERVEISFKGMFAFVKKVVLSSGDVVPGADGWRCCFCGVDNESTAVMCTAAPCGREHVQVLYETTALSLDGLCKASFSFPNRLGDVFWFTDEGLTGCMLTLVTEVGMCDAVISRVDDVAGSGPPELYLPPSQLFDQLLAYERALRRMHTCMPHGDAGEGDGDDGLPWMSEILDELLHMARVDALLKHIPQVHRFIAAGNKTERSDDADDDGADDDADDVALARSTLLEVLCVYGTWMEQTMQAEGLRMVGLRKSWSSTQYLPLFLSCQNKDIMSSLVTLANLNAATAEVSGNVILPKDIAGVDRSVKRLMGLVQTSATQTPQLRHPLFKKGTPVVTAKMPGRTVHYERDLLPPLLLLDAMLNTSDWDLGSRVDALLGSSVAGLLFVFRGLMSTFTGMLGKQEAPATLAEIVLNTSSERIPTNTPSIPIPPLGSTPSRGGTGGEARMRTPSISSEGRADTEVRSGMLPPLGEQLVYLCKVDRLLTFCGHQCTGPLHCREEKIRAVVEKLGKHPMPTVVLLWESIWGSDAAGAGAGGETTAPLAPLSSNDGAAARVEDGKHPAQWADKLLKLKTVLEEGEIPAIARAFSKGGAHVNFSMVVDEEHQLTPMHVVARRGSEDILAFLVERGADAHCLTDDGKTPLDLCLEHGHEQCAAFLAQETSSLKASKVQRFVRMWESGHCPATIEDSSPPSSPYTPCPTSSPFPSTCDARAEEEEEAGYVLLKPLEAETCALRDHFRSCAEDEVLVWLRFMVVVHRISVARKVCVDMATSTSVAIVGNGRPGRSTLITRLWGVHDVSSKGLVRLETPETRVRLYKVTSCGFEKLIERGVSIVRAVVLLFAPEDMGLLPEYQEALVKASGLRCLFCFQKSDQDDDMNTFPERHRARVARVLGGHFVSCDDGSMVAGNITVVASSFMNDHRYDVQNAKIWGPDKVRQWITRQTDEVMH